MRRCARCATRRARRRPDRPTGPARRFFAPASCGRARFGEVIRLMKPSTAWSLARETLASWSADYASSMGAALAHYTMFSIAPLLLIVISVAGLFFGEQAARGEILDQLEGLMGVDGARAVQTLLASVNHPNAGVPG